MNRAIHAALLLLAMAAPAAASDPTPGLLRTSLPLQVTIDGRQTTLESLVIRPDRPGRFPLVVMIHGTPRSEPGHLSDALARVSPASFNTAAVAFAQRGYATAAVLRRGFGHSEGPYAESLATGSTCDRRDYLPVARASGQDVAAAVARLRREPWADPERILLLGLSTGGVAVSAAASAGVPGAVGVIDFAGGRGSAAPDKVCDTDSLVQMFAALGRTARLPGLWVFSENDHYFAPDLARRMHAAYTGAGAPAVLAMLPPFGADGHSLLTSAPVEAWWPSVEPFLARLGLPTRTVIEFPPTPSLPAPHTSSATCLAGFRDFQASRTPAKAFAASPGGGCGWSLRARTPAEARQAALENCSNRNPGCSIYATGGALGSGE